MGLLRKDPGRNDRTRQARSASRIAGTNHPTRICRFEQMEPRRLLSADFSPIQVGAVYFEDDSPHDDVGDLIEFTFTGGAPGTQLTELVIDTDKDGLGLGLGDVFFDTEPGGRGAYAAVGPRVVDQTGIDSVQVTVADGGTTLVIRPIGFDPGEKLVLSIDVDEQGFVESSSNAVAEGEEFQYSHLRATFVADHYYDATGTDVFLDLYDSKLAGSGLNLPDDDYDPPSPYMPPDADPGPVRTAGAILPVQQTPLPITIAGTVFEDIDLDNTQDPGDPGLAGVTLTLYEWAGDSYASVSQTTTDAVGNYLFEDVLPGTYRIVETQPAGYFSIGATAGTVDGAARGEVAGPDEIRSITLLGGEDSIDNDFAEARPASLSGHVYHDADDDGVMVPGEAGIGGVSVQVQYLPADGPLPAPIQVLTEADGSWSAGSLIPGQYRVVEDQPDGYFDGLDAAGTAGGAAHNPGDLIDQIHLASGQSGQQYDFGELLPASISGRVHADFNGNCTYDPGEWLLSGVTIHLLDASGSRIQQTTTDGNGEYIFAGLEPGTYGVEEIQPVGYVDGPELVGSAGGMLLAPDSIVGVALASSVAAVRYDFCELPLSSISGRVHADFNGNSVYDKGDVLLSGVTVHLLDSSGGIVETTQTDTRGEYSFVDLFPGVYGLQEIQPQGYFDGRDHVGSAGGSLLSPDSIIDVDLPAATDAVRYDFSEVPPSSLSGYVYADEDNNGLFEVGEQGIAGVEIVLLDAGGTPTGEKATTNAAGFYRFESLWPGAYGVAETQPDDYFDGLDTAGSVGGVAHNPGDEISEVVLKPAVSAENYNFGELRPASISGRVHGELDGDCVHDPGEPLLAGVTIHLLDASGNRLQTTTTDENGEYLFGNLPPGTYGVEEIQPEGYLQGATHPGSAGGRVERDDRIVEVQLGAGVDAVEYNFCEMVPASISGYVFQDGPTIVLRPLEQAPDPATVRDGRFTPDDTPIAGVVLRLGDGSGAPLLDADGRLVTTVTDSAGHYEFAMLERGLYTILEVHPDGYVDGVDTPGSNGGSGVNPHQGNYQAVLQRFDLDLHDDAIVEIRLSMGDAATSYNFSEVLFEETPLLIPPPPPSPPPSAPRPAPPLPAESPPVLFFALPPQVQGRSMFGGSGPDDYTWHLSVINAGRPRGNHSGTAVSAVSIFGTLDHPNPYFDPITWTGADLGQSQWIIADGQGAPISELFFGLPGAIPVAGDFNGDGVAEVGVFIAGNWFLDLDGNHVWDEDDFWAFLGGEDDLPVVGDWDGDGKDDIGIFGPEWLDDRQALAAEPGLPDAANRSSSGTASHSSGTAVSAVATRRYKNIPPEPHQAPVRRRTMKRSSQGPIRSDLIDHVFRYGTETDQPVAGDFNGDGTASIGIFREGTWRLDVDGNGHWSADDVTVELGRKGDIPVVGDFNGDGTDQLGVYRAGTWFLDTNGNGRLDARDKVFQLGGPGDRPVVADFNGDGIDEIAIYQEHTPPAEQASR